MTLPSDSHTPGAGAKGRKAVERAVHIVVLFAQGHRWLRSVVRSLLLPSRRAPVMWHRRLIGICCLGLVVAGCDGTRSSGATNQRGPAHYALFLGDGLTLGAHIGGVPYYGDTRCSHPASMTTGKGGWPCVLVHFLRSMTPHLVFENDSVPNEDGCSIFSVSYSCIDLSPARQRSLTPQPNSQMANALAYLRQHRGQVGLITFELAFNDWNPGPGTAKAMELREDRILAWLHRAAPRAEFILMDAPGTKESNQTGNPFAAVYRREASTYAGSFVDLYAHFATHPELLDGSLHPNDAGQRTIARVIWQAYTHWIRAR